MAPNKTPPELVDIYPLYNFDRSPAVESMHMAWLFRVNSCLDPQMLQSSLVQLLHIGHWRKFAGRFNRNSNGCLELRTPRNFPCDYDIIGYSHRDLSLQKAADHELAGQMPGKETVASLYTQHPSYRELLCHSDALANGTMEDWIRENLPPLALHITTFEDTTIVSLLWRHVIADGGGMAELVHAWCLVLSGRQDDVPLLLGTKENILWEIGDKACREGNRGWCMAGRSLGLWATCKTLVQFFMWRRITVPKFEARSVSIPGTFIGQLKERALRQLAVYGLQKLPDLSDSLIIRAWFLKKVLDAEPKASNMLLAMPVNPRSRLSELRPPGGVYVQNMLSWVFISLSLDVVRGPLVVLALEIRRRTQEQIAPGQIGCYYGFKHAQEKKLIPTEKLFYFTENPGNDFPVAYNDLCSLRVRENVDFGAAVIKKGNPDAVGVNPPGKPTFFIQKNLGRPLGRGYTRLPILVCSGKDTSGNYLFDGVLSIDTWNSIEEDFEGHGPI